MLSASASVAITRLTWPFFAAAPFFVVFGVVAALSHWGSAGAGMLATAVAAAGLVLVFPSGTIFGATSPGLVLFVAIALLGSRLIAERNKTNAALRESEARLRETLDQVRTSEEQMRRAQKMEAVGQLAAGVAHNFNNLLQVTMGYTEVLLDGSSADRTAVEEIRKATERGAMLTRQLMAFGRRQEARTSRVDLEAALGELHDILTRVIREDIELTMRLDTGGANVVIDPSDLEQVVFNLVINARDALPAGGRIRVEADRTRVDASSNPADYPVVSGEYARIAVADDGVGMSADVLAHLFEPFFTTKEVGEGTGLGLAFVHGVARHGGGFVNVRSAPGKGTTVSVFLPVAAGTAPAGTRAAPAAAPPSLRRAAHAATILFVEDESAVRAATERILTRAGYRVRTAANADEACAIFDPAPADIDLLLTDVVMPGMHGPELAARLAGVRPDLPVVFVSGYSDRMPALPVVSSRAAFVAKPFTVASLVDAIEDLLVPKGR